MGRGCGGREWKPRVRHWCWWCAGLEFQQGCGGQKLFQLRRNWTHLVLICVLQCHVAFTLLLVPQNHNRLRHEWLVFVGAQMALSSYPATQIIAGISFITVHIAYPIINKNCLNADSMHGWMCRDKECPFSGITNSGRVWRKVLKSEAWGVTGALPQDHTFGTAYFKKTFFLFL